ncbi:hypothetical protein [Streptomyces orinoci]|uniref:Cytochrome P450 n=1 Tax=Streptomyces orinoci TaxID=67339 RepID=A0ABV3K820_STRON|nr:hypothetical protein [Streptomyces orinoci]
MNSPGLPGPLRASEIPPADPYPVHRRYRAADPVHRAEGAWFLFRHRDVARVLTDRAFGRARCPPPSPANAPGCGGR